jgi:hypothetical protein
MTSNAIIKERDKTAKWQGNRRQRFNARYTAPP